MLTYKIINKIREIYTYKYYPHGRDIKIEGGLVEINISNGDFKIIQVAELDEIQSIPMSEYKIMVDYINKLRKENNYPIKEIDVQTQENYEYYKFADILVNEIIGQIYDKNLKDKGVII